MPASRRRVLSMFGVLALVSLAACEPVVAPVPVRSGRQALATVPAKGTSASLDFATWNLEWFGDPANGPTNDAQQLANARDVIAGADMDIWGFQEIVDSADFSALEAQLPGYTGFVANEAHVTNGPQYYSGFSNTEQKVGIL